MTRSGKPKKIITKRQLVVLSTLVILVIAGFFIFSNISPAKFNTHIEDDSESAGGTSVLMEADDILHARLLDLQQMDRSYVSQLVEQESPVALEVSQLSIQHAEQDLMQTIDSMETARKRLDSRTSADLWKLTTYFKTIMENRNFLKALRNQPKGNEQESENKALLIALEQRLKEKESLIAELDKKLSGAGQPNRMSEKPALANAKKEKEETELLEYKPAPGETMEDLKQRNVNLKLAFNNTATALGVMTKKYELLKKDYQQLSNQVKGSSQNQ